MHCNVAEWTEVGQLERQAVRRSFAAFQAERDGVIRLARQLGATASWLSWRCPALWTEALAAAPARGVAGLAWAVLLALRGAGAMPAAVYVERSAAPARMQAAVGAYRAARARTGLAVVPKLGASYAYRNGSEWFTRRGEQLARCRAGCTAVLMR